MVKSEVIKNGNTSKSIWKRIRKCWQLYLFILPALLYILLFCYKPMYGILIAFKDFSIRKGVWNSPWMGFANFERLFNSYWFPIALKNTLTISFLDLFLGFPLGVILALMFNEVKSIRYRSIVQTVSYAPHFISTVVMCGITIMMLSPNNGIINKFIQIMGFEPIFFMQHANLFKWVYSLSGVWQGVGWGSIIYFSALSSVDKSLLEAAEKSQRDRLTQVEGFLWM